MKKKMMPKNNNLSKVLLIIAVVVIALVVYFNYRDSIQKSPPLQKYTSCGNGICDVRVGENFLSCPSDCGANPAPVNDCPNGKPGPSNTGYKTPVGPLIPYTGPMTITTPGTIISNAIITGHLRINADDVTVTNSEINGYVEIRPNFADTTISNVFMDCSGFNYCIQSSSGYSDGIMIEHSTFKNAISAHILGSSMRILGNEFSNSVDAIKLFSGEEKTIVEGNWIHDLDVIFGVTHNDAIQITGGDAYIECNNLDVQEGASVVSARQFSGLIENLIIRKNWINGGALSIILVHDLNLPSSTNARVEENIFGNDCRFGTMGGDMVEVTSCGNIWANSGVSVSDNDPNGGCSMVGSFSGWTQTYETCL